MIETVIEFAMTCLHCRHVANLANQTPRLHVGGAVYVLGGADVHLAHRLDEAALSAVGEKRLAGLVARPRQSVILKTARLIEFLLQRCLRSFSSSV